MEECECKKEENENPQFIGFCENDECGDFYCENCKGDHAGHREDTLEGQELEEFLEQMNSPEYQKEVEQQALAEEFSEYYERILKENEEETKMFYQIVQYLKDGNADELVKLLDKIKQTKVEFDNNKPMQISKKMDEYRKRIKDLDDQFPTGNLEDRKKKIELMNKGRQLFRSGEYYEALQNLQEAIKIDNNYVDAILIKAQTQIQLENYNDAVACCDYVIQIDRLNGEAYYIKIIALILGQRYDVLNEALRQAYRKISYKFTFNTLHLINQLERSSPTVKKHLSELNYDLKRSLFSLINHEEITTQICQQYFTQLVVIIKLADQEEINHALMQYNLNFEVIEEYQKQYDVDIRPKLDEKAWYQMVEWLENYQKQKMENQLDQQFIYQLNIRSQGQISTDNPSASQISNTGTAGNENPGEPPTGIVSEISQFYQDSQLGQTAQFQQQKDVSNVQAESQIPEQNPTLPAVNTQNQQQNQNEIQTPGGQSSSQFQSEFSKFIENQQINQAAANEQQQQEPVVRPLDEQITQQPSNQFVNQLNNFLQDSATNQTNPSQEQPKAEGQIPENENVNQTPNQFNSQLENFLNGSQPNQETPNEQQQIQNPVKEMAKLIPTQKTEQQLADFYKDEPKDKNDQSKEKDQQAAGVTPSIQQELQNFLNGQEYKATEQQPTDQQQQDKEEITFDETKRLEQVLKFCNETIKKGKPDHQIYFKKAMILKKLNDFENSMENLDYAIQMKETEANYYYQKALLLIKLDALDLAIVNFDEAISRNPNEPNYYLEKGNELKRQNILNEAEICFELARQKSEAIK
ncbi:unnamed protein product (macronuclear) [Paramecium tetraurelia]|uniref:Tetratricopeptide repeat protein n=1 Tax=Paramecium tetraurelia TaxID=5888 RepID=A0CFF6_PARTE|nr:uncharacterized protein GSPATT00037962001 [Paramecium tetraurelia]CAK69523.1 unnamed protein product [Paramecium tetraurelia]|eukprot:XP_001436920.1 hypothetical protein (macronuclear) [Paramecium tetraurelia strain d4-2]